MKTNPYAWLLLSVEGAYNYIYNEKLIINMVKDFLCCVIPLEKCKEYITNIIGNSMAGKNTLMVI